MRFQADKEALRGRWIGQLEYSLVRGLLKPIPDESLLDVGCGTGYFTRCFARDQASCGARRNASVLLPIIRSIRLDHRDVFRPGPGNVSAGDGSSNAPLFRRRSPAPSQSTLVPRGSRWWTGWLSGCSLAHQTRGCWALRDGRFVSRSHGHCAALPIRQSACEDV